MREARKVVRMNKNWMNKEVDRNKIAYREGYNKAIDDFVDKADDLLGASDDDIYCKESIKEIAEQLKAGDVD